jgi:hypothetical protein
MYFEFAIVPANKVNYADPRTRWDGLAIVTRGSPRDEFWPFIVGIPTLQDAVEAVELSMEGVEWDSQSTGFYTQPRKPTPRTKRERQAVDLAAPAYLLPGEHVPRWKRPGTLGK